MTLIFTPSRETRYLSKLYLPGLKLYQLTPSCVTVNETKAVATVAHRILISLSKIKIQLSVPDVCDRCSRK